MSELAWMTAQELTARFADRSLSPVEVAEAALGRVEALESRLNAFTHLDPETTLAAAQASEARYGAGEPLGAFDGVPVAIKDVYLVQGWPTRFGSLTVDPAQNPDADAPAVAALRRRGFVPLGMTTTPEFGWKGVTDNPRDGITANPWDVSKTPGGSSGGSAAAVASGSAPVALGTDGGGSIRIPASFCGLVGMKPTAGRAPMWPPSVFDDLSHVGPITRTVEDAAAMLDVIAEPDPRDPTLPPPAESFAGALAGDIKGLRVAFSPTLGYVDVRADVAEAVAAAARAFETLGAHVEEADPGFADPLDDLAQFFYGALAYRVRNYDEATMAKLDSSLAKIVRSPKWASLDRRLEAAEARRALTVRMSEFHQRYDLLLTPTLPLTAFEKGNPIPDGWDVERQPSWTPFTYPFNLTGQPACSVPCGFGADGLPVGLQIVGPRHADAAVLRAAGVYQRAHPLLERKPTL
ncbi:MAG: amidase [Maricaulaceae bacterium]|jgi:aspartyl-tRNA(Asn)/glutamyl-tRNA(Gln) amidotransferase subunit A